MKQDKKLQEKCEEYLAGWKRAKSDYQNLKKEHEQSIKKIGEISIIGFARVLLPVIDHFELAISHVPEESKNEEWVKGFYHIKRQFDDILENLGVKKIKTDGEQFNPELHEAVSSDDKGRPKDEIIKEIQSGYIINNSVVRHAKVIVNN